jgi:phosphoglycolate phosphatase
MKYNTVIFDLDGTLSDSSRGITRAVAYAMERFGVREIDPAILRRFIGPPLYDSFSRYFGLDARQADRAVALYREYYHPIGQYENVLYPGIEGVLAQLTAGKISCYVCTSKPQEVTESVLAYLGIAGYFKGVVGASMDRSLNDKAALLKVLERRFCPPGPMVMVGDTRFDREGAAARGMDFIGVSWGFAAPGDLDGADTVKDPAKLLKKLTEEHHG